MHHGVGDGEKEENIDYRASFRLVRELMRTRLGGFALAFLFLIFATAVNLVNPVIAKTILDSVIPAHDSTRLVVYSVLYAANIFLSLVFNYLLYIQLVKTGQKLIVSLKKKLLDHLFTLGMDFYSENPVGKLSARVQSDTGTLYELFTETAVTIFKDIFMFIAVFVIMFFYNRELTMLLMPVFPVILLIVWLFVKLSSPLFVKSRKIMAEITGWLTEQLNGIEVLQAYNREENAASHMHELNERKFRAEYHAELYGVVFFLGIFALQPVSTAAVFGAGGIQVLHGKLTVGVLIMFILYITQLFEPIFRFSEHISIIQRSFSAAHRLSRLLAVKPSVCEVPEPCDIDSIKKGIEFRNVWMRYRKNSPWVLRNISFSLEKGHSIAIAGETGGGKTSLANLLFRFYDFQKGYVLVDGMDIRQLSFRSLRSVFGLIQQDIYLFPGTIMENLKMMDFSIPDSRVMDAIKIMGLEGFFRKLPLSMTVVEKGQNLSIGEKQVIALARALVLDQEFLVLDEATSHMDPYTERVVTGAVQRLLKHKTLIIIAHRLSTIRNVDRILMISGGELKESGTHDELIAAGGLYADYYRLQSGMPVKTEIGGNIEENINISGENMAGGTDEIRA